MINRYSGPVDREKGWRGQITAVPAAPSKIAKTRFFAQPGVRFLVHLHQNISASRRRHNRYAQAPVRYWRNETPEAPSAPSLCKCRSPQTAKLKKSSACPERKANVSCAGEGALSGTPFDCNEWTDEVSRHHKLAHCFLPLSFFSLELSTVALIFHKYNIPARCPNQQQNNQISILIIVGLLICGNLLSFLEFQRIRPARQRAPLEAIKNPVPA